MLFQKSGKTRASHFLLSLDDKGQVTRQVGARFEISLGCFQVREILAFVVAGATGKQRASFNARFERRRVPKLERLRRLHIVMAVNQKMWPPLFAATGSFCQHNGMPAGWAKLRLESDLLAMFHQPIPARLHVGTMLRLSRNTG